MRTFFLCLLSIAFFLGSVFALRTTDDMVGDKRGSAPNSNVVPHEQAAKVHGVREKNSSENSVKVMPPREKPPYGLVRRVNVGQRKVVALTFDFCELATTTTGYNKKLVDYLQKNSIRATFFMGGKWLHTHAVRARQILRSELFEIANHAWSHGNFALLDAQGMHEQIEYMQAQYTLFRDEIHVREPEKKLPAFIKYFRFPYGRSSPQALRLLQEKGLLPIQWDVVGEMRPDNAEPYAVQEVLAQVRPGSILLFHGNMVPKGTEVLIPRLIKRLQEQGYAFVTVGQLLSMGEPELVEDGYFIKPGDNVHLDTRFGVDGTGLTRP